jgi:hypothetical protein
VALREIEWGGIDWIHLAQDRDRISEHGDELLASIKCLKIHE